MPKPASNLPDTEVQPTPEEAKQELHGDGAIDPHQESTPLSQKESKGGKTISEKEKLMGIFCRIPFVNEIEEDECDRLADIMTVRRLEKGDILIEQGKKDNSLYILISGRLQVNRSTGGNKHVTLACIREGEMAGEMGFLDDSEHSATLMADDTSEILQINRKDLKVCWKSIRKPSTSSCAQSPAKCIKSPSG